MTPESEHAQKYERLAQWLGIEKVCALVPFSADHIRDALDAGDEHLNTLPLHMWDAKHGTDATSSKCPCCKQEVRTAAEPGVLGLFRERWRLQRESGVPMPAEYPRGWSLSDTVCTLKHVARYHVAGSGYLND